MLLKLIFIIDTSTAATFIPSKHSVNIINIIAKSFYIPPYPINIFDKIEIHA